MRNVKETLKRATKSWYICVVGDHWVVHTNKLHSLEWFCFCTERKIRLKLQTRTPTHQIQPIRLEIFFFSPVSLFQSYCLFVCTSLWREFFPCHLIKPKNICFCAKCKHMKWNTSIQKASHHHRYHHHASTTQTSHKHKLISPSFIRFSSTFFE